MEILIAHPVTQDQSEALKAIMKVLKVNFEIEENTVPVNVIAEVRAAADEADKGYLTPYTGLKQMLNK